MVTNESTNISGNELLAVFAQRRALFECVLESEEPTAKQTLIETLEYSRQTINRVVRDLRDRDLIELESDGLTATLLARLVWKQYRTLDQHVAAIERTGQDDPLPWHSDVERRAAIQLIGDRLDLLEYMATAPREKRDLVAAVESAQSTVDRAIRELELAGLVMRPSAGYTISPAVRTATQQYCATVERVEDILAARKLLSCLSPGCQIETPLLTGASVESCADAPPYHLPVGLRDRIAAAERVSLFLPALATPQLLAVVRDGHTLDLLVPRDLFETMTTEFPGPLAAMAAERGGPCTVSVVDTQSTLPPFGLVLADSEGQRPSGSRTQSGDTDGFTTVSVIVYDEQRTIQGAIHNDTDAAIQWADDCHARAHNGRVEVTEELHNLAPGVTDRAGVGLAVNDTDRVDRETEGFVRLMPEYFAQRAPAPTMTGWRAGFDLVDVHAGYAIDREREHNGTRYNLTEQLVEELGGGTNHVVLGPPGSGKSTICKAVACRWYEQGRGPVFYRESGTGTTFDSPAILEAQLRAAEGHVLVVVEDAARAETNAIIRVMQAFRGTQSVTFLLDARRGEWTDPDALPIDAGLDAYRHEAIETVSVPALDEAEAERFVQQFEQTTAHVRDSVAASQFRDRERSATTALPLEDAADAPGELLLLLHRLVMSVDPLAGDDTPTPTTFLEDVQRTEASLREHGELSLDVGVLVNLLNAAGIGVSPPLVCALAVDGDRSEIAAIRDELSALEGSLLFDREESVGAKSDSYRTVHEEWSARFLDHLLDSETEYAASQRVGRCVTALLSLADDAQQRERIRAAFGGTAPAIERIAAAPGEWADTMVERLFGLGLRRRTLAPLFGTTDDSAIDLPNTCSQEVVVDCTRWRARMAREAGTLDRAEHEYDVLGSFADEVEATDPEWAATLRGRRLNGLGIVAWRRSEFDTAEDYYTRAITPYRKADNRQRLASTRMNLGLVAYARGDLERAERYYRECLEMYRDLGDVSKETMVMFNLGTIIEVTRSMTVAGDHYRECLDRYRDIGDRRMEALCLGDLGRTLIRQGNLTAAQTYCAQALDLCRETGAKIFETYCLVYLGMIHQMRGDFDTTETYYQQSLSIRRDLGERRAEARCLTALGRLARKRNDLDRATECCTMSRDICREIDDRRDEATSLIALGEIDRERGDLSTAEERALTSLSIYREIGDVSGVAACQRLLGRIACVREQFSIADDHLTQALTGFREAGYRCEAARTLTDRGDLDRQRDDPAAAREWFDEAVCEFREIGAVRDIIEMTEQLAAVCEALDEFDVALDHCETARTLAQETEFVEIPASLDERRTRLSEKVDGADD